MKLLLFSDLHCNNMAANFLLHCVQEADIVVGAGDFCSAHRGLHRIFTVLKNISKPFIVVPGNNETDNALRQELEGQPNIFVLHGEGCQIQDIAFFGIGGGIPTTPFGKWSFDFTEHEAFKLLKDCPQQCVLISHSPPYGVVDVSSSGKHLGSKTIREQIEKKQPRLVVCGHIHGSQGKIGKIKESYVINAGPRGIIWDLEKNAIVE